MTDARPSIAIFGLGAFGRLAASHLAPHADLVVHDPRFPAGTDATGIAGEGTRLVGFDEAAIADWIILATPVQAMREVLARLAGRVRPGAVVADVGSVKIRPVEWMLETLPPHAQVLGTHPMFGPETAREKGGIAGEPVALCRARIEDDAYVRARTFLAETLSLRVIELTPDEHDRQAALIQGITHLIGHAAAEMGLPDLPTATLAYRRLLQMKQNTERDSPALFDAIQRLNPYAGEVRRDFLDALIRTIRRAGDTLPGEDRP